MAFNWRKFPWTNLHDLNLDWIIQTVKTLENNLTDAVSKFTEIANAAITKALMGSGDLTIDKAGAVNISGNGVKIEDKRTGGLIQIFKGFAIGCTGTFAEIANTTANKTLVLAYNGILQMFDNNNKPVVISGVDTVDTVQTSSEARKNLAASCGYVDTAANALDDIITTEAGTRENADSALQSTIDNVIMPLLTKVEKRAPCVVHVNNTDTTITAEDDTKIKTALLNRTPIVLAVDDTAANNLYNYHFLNCTIVPTADNIDLGFMIYFQTIDGIYKAHILNHGKNSLLASTIVFETT